MSNWSAAGYLRAIAGLVSQAALALGMGCAAPALTLDTNAQVSIVAILDEGRVVEGMAVFDGALIHVPAGGVLVLATIEGGLADPLGAPLPRESLSKIKVHDGQPSTGCARCRTYSAVPPMVYQPGDDCPIPPFAKLRAFENGTEEISLDPLALPVRLELEGPCPCDDPGNVRVLGRETLFPEHDNELLTAFARTASGSVVGIGEEHVWLVEPGGRQTLRAVSGPRSGGQLDAGAFPNGEILISRQVLSTIAEVSIEVLRIRPPGEPELEVVESPAFASLSRVSSIVRAGSSVFVLGTAASSIGNDTDSLVVECTTPATCERVRLPCEVSTAVNVWTSSDGQTWIAHANGNLNVRERDGTWRCIANEGPIEIADYPPGKVVSTGPLGRRMIACADSIRFDGESAAGVFLSPPGDPTSLSAWPLLTLRPGRCGGLVVRGADRAWVFLGESRLEASENGELIETPKELVSTYWSDLGGGWGLGLGPGRLIYLSPPGLEPALLRGDPGGLLGAARVVTRKDQVRVLGQYATLAFDGDGVGARGVAPWAPRPVLAAGIDPSGDSAVVALEAEDGNLAIGWFDLDSGTFEEIETPALPALPASVANYSPGGALVSSGNSVVDVRRARATTVLSLPADSVATSVSSAGDGAAFIAGSDGIVRRYLAGRLEVADADLVTNTVFGAHRALCADRASLVGWSRGNAPITDYEVTVEAQRLLVREASVSRAIPQFTFGRPILGIPGSKGMILGYDKGYLLEPGAPLLMRTGLRRLEHLATTHDSAYLIGDSTLVRARLEGRLRP
ncbi:MAG: hypothetical protein HYV07_12325 [Deltaproteobacteria bacterium]|nr:hypothetical protein [Deltaproteobacteria bacterium]